MFRVEPNSRIHAVAAGVALIGGWYFSIRPLEWALVCLCICLVFAAECFNTAVESIVDLVSPDYHQLAGRAKDVAAAGVLFLSIGAATVGLIIFLPYLLNW